MIVTCRIRLGFGVQPLARSRTTRTQLLRNDMISFNCCRADPFFAPEALEQYISLAKDRVNIKLAVLVCAVNDDRFVGSCRPVKQVHDNAIAVGTVWHTLTFLKSDIVRSQIKQDEVDCSSTSLNQSSLAGIDKVNLARKMAHLSKLSSMTQRGCSTVAR